MSRGIQARRSQRNPGVIELHYDDAQRQVHIVPPDNDGMAMSVETAIEACRAFHQQIVFKDQFDHLLEKLGEWFDNHSDAVAGGYLTTQDSGLLFLVVTQSRQHDDKLEAALTELDLEISQDDDFGLIKLGVHAIPNASKETIHSFVSSKMALRFIKDGDRD